MRFPNWLNFLNFRSIHGKLYCPNSCSLSLLVPFKNKLESIIFGVVSPYLYRFVASSCSVQLYKMISRFIVRYIYHFVQFSRAAVIS